MPKQQQAAAPKQRTRHIKANPVKPLTIPAIKQKEYKYNLAGFDKAAKQHSPFNVLAQIDHPLIKNAIIQQIQFKGSGSYGLCVYHKGKEEFEEAPAGYSDYRMTQRMVELRFGFTHETPSPIIEAYGSVLLLSPCGYAQRATIANVNVRRLKLVFDYADIRLEMYFSAYTGREVKRPKDARYPLFKAILSTYSDI